MSRLLVAALLALVGTSAHAVYKCGNSYSQTPCAADAKKLDLKDSLQSSTGAKLEPISPEKERANAALCEKTLREKPAWKDRDSVKVSDIRRSLNSTTKKVNGVPSLLAPYLARTNAKNSFGAYGGENIAICYFDMKEENVVDYYVAD